MSNAIPNEPKRWPSVSVAACIIEGMLLCRNIVIGWMLGSGLVIILGFTPLLMVDMTNWLSATATMVEALEETVVGYQITQNDVLSLHLFVERVTTFTALMASMGILGIGAGFALWAFRHWQPTPLKTAVFVLSIGFWGVLLLPQGAFDWRYDGPAPGMSSIWINLVWVIAAILSAEVVVKQKARPYLLLGLFPLALGVFVLVANRDILLAANMWQAALIIILAMGVWSCVCFGVGQVARRTTAPKYLKPLVLIPLVVASSVAVAAHSIAVSGEIMRTAALSKSEIEGDTTAVAQEKWKEMEYDMIAVRGKEEEITALCLDIPNRAYRTTPFAYSECLEFFLEYSRGTAASTTPETNLFQRVLGAAIDNLDDAELRILAYRLDKNPWFFATTDVGGMKCISALGRQYALFNNGKAPGYTLSLREKPAKTALNTQLESKQYETSGFLQYYTFVSPGFEMPKSCTGLSS